MRTVPKAPHRARILDALHRSPFFQTLPAEALPRVEGFAELQAWEAGEMLMREGDPSDCFLVLLEGVAEIRITQRASGESTTVARLESPEMVGEQGLILGEPRQATVVAEGPLVVLRFDAAAFAQMFAKVPGFGLEVCRVLARRLARTSHQVPLPEPEAAVRADPDLLERLPLPFLRRHQVVPLSARDGVITLGFVEDPATAVLEAVRRLVPGLRVRPVRVSRSAWEEALQAAEATATAPAAPSAARSRPAGPLSADALAGLLHRMVAEGASDLHLSAGQSPRWRVDGELRVVAGELALRPGDAFELLKPLLDAGAVARFEAKEELDFAHGLPGLARFRVNAFRDGRGTCAVLRQIPEKVMPLERLDLPPAVVRLCEHGKGLILVTGPTGSGKSTTLAAMVDHLNRTRKGHILTLEDPVEFVHESAGCLVNQREVGTHTNSFARALRAALREDPDIVLVGEMRDLETISLALETASTGHLVLGTLHTATAVGTVDRIVNLYPAEQQAQVRTTLSDVLRGVISQALCRRIGGGRVAAVEILVVNAAVSNLIREAKTHQIQSLMSTGQAQGNVMLNQSLARLVRARTIEADEAMRWAVDKADLARVLGQAAPSA